MLGFRSLPRLFSRKLCLFNYKNSKTFTTTSIVYSTQTKTTTNRLPHGYNGPTPYSLFIKEKTEGMTMKGDKVTEAFKCIAADWKIMSMEEKNVYYENSKKMKAEKRAEFDSLPNDTKQSLLIKNVERNEKRKQLSKKREIHQFRKSTNRPKQPASSFMLFMKDTFAKAEQKPKGKEEMSKFAANAGELWKNMSEEEKKPYEERGMQNKEEYQRKLTKWKENYLKEITEWKEKHKTKLSLKDKTTKPGEEKKKMESAKGKRENQEEKQTKSKSGKHVEKKESKKEKSGKKEE